MTIKRTKPSKLYEDTKEGIKLQKVDETKRHIKNQSRALFNSLSKDLIPQVE